ncbi:MAG: ribonuclease III [Acidiferrobacterales bacterium]
MSEYDRLISRIGIDIDENLLRQALTHRSKSATNYERLEFLGDSVLGFIVSSELYGRYPELSEGELTRLRATHVRKESLAEVARSIDLGSFLHLGSGELRSGGFDRDSILADALEALFGAIYVDKGITAVQDCIHRLFDDRFSILNDEALEKDPKTLLQEYLQKSAIETPVYDVVEVKGAAHDQSFVVSCRVAGVDAPFIGEGRSRKKAEQDAASKALATLTG